MNFECLERRDMLTTAGAELFSVNFESSIHPNPTAAYEASAVNNGKTVLVALSKLSDGWQVDRFDGLTIDGEPNLEDSSRQPFMFENPEFRPFNAFELGNLNDDSIIDLVFGTESGIYLAFGLQQGGYSSPTEVTTDFPVESIEVVDLDGDALDDLVVQTREHESELMTGGATAIITYLSDGEGNANLVDEEFFDPNGTFLFVMRDGDSDGDVDLFVVRDDSLQFGRIEYIMFSNDGSGELTCVGGFASDGFQRRIPTALEIADMNEDG